MADIFLEIKHYCYFFLCGTWVNLVGSQVWFLLSITPHVQAENSHFYVFLETGVCWNPIPNHSISCLLMDIRGTSISTRKETWAWVEAELSMTLLQGRIRQLWKIPSLLPTLTSLQIGFLEVTNRYKEQGVWELKKQTLPSYSSEWSCFMTSMAMLWSFFQPGCRHVLFTILAKEISNCVHEII